MRRGALLLAIVAIAIGVSACLPPPPPLPAGKPVPQAPAPRQGFDAACAPTLDKMTAWWNSSPYTSAAIYLGGSSVYCRSYMQPQLTADWVGSVRTQGWKLIPIWVGPQAPCTTLTDVSKLPADPAVAYQAGLQEAFDASIRANALGMPNAPIYYDMEYYPPGNPACVQAVQQFAAGWAAALHYWQHTAGFYSSLCAGIVDVASGAYAAWMDSVWIAAWAYNDQYDARYATFVPNLFGFSSCGGTPPRVLPDTLWTNHQRLRQYRGGHNETWGGVMLNVDSNADDGRTFP
jgi:hypothetical protein